VADLKASGSSCRAGPASCPALRRRCSASVRARLARPHRADQGWAVEADRKALEELRAGKYPGLLT